MEGYLQLWQCLHTCSAIGGTVHVPTPQCISSHLHCIRSAIVDFRTPAEGGAKGSGVFRVTRPGGAPSLEGALTMLFTVSPIFSTTVLIHIHIKDMVAVPRWLKCACEFCDQREPQCTDPSGWSMPELTLRGSLHLAKSPPRFCLCQTSRQYTCALAYLLACVALEQQGRGAGKS